MRIAVSDEEVEHHSLKEELDIKARDLGNSLQLLSDLLNRTIIFIVLLQNLRKDFLMEFSPSIPIETLDHIRQALIL